jgi:transposase
VGVPLYLEGIFIWLKGQTFQHYTEEFKRMAVERYENGEESYDVLTKELGLPSSTQLSTPSIY